MPDRPDIMGKSKRSARRTFKTPRKTPTEVIGQAPGSRGRRDARRLVLLLFFLSGACGLVYQVVWTRMLTQVFGTSAVGVVLAACMSGLALGSWLLGSLADCSHSPLRLYAILEVGGTGSELAL